MSNTLRVFLVLFVMAVWQCGFLLLSLWWEKRK